MENKSYFVCRRIPAKKCRRNDRFENDHFEIISEIMDLAKSPGEEKAAERRAVGDFMTEVPG